MENLVFMTIITSRKHKEAIVALLIEAKARTIDTVFTRDCIDANLLRFAFGLIPDEDEMLINCLLTENAADMVFKVLYDKYNFKKPRKGVAFTVKLDKIAV